MKAAMNEINAARRMREAAMEKAEAEKIQVVKGAEADAESKFLAGQGIARQRQAIINGLRESVKVHMQLLSTDIKRLPGQQLILRVAVGCRCHIPLLVTTGCAHAQWLICHAKAMTLLCVCRGSAKMYKTLARARSWR